MQEYTYVTLRQKPELKEEAATWFHDKWEVPQEAYLECADSRINKSVTSFRRPPTARKTPISFVRSTTLV